MTARQARGNFSASVRILGVGESFFCRLPRRHFVQWAGSDVHNGYVGNAWHGSLPNFPSPVNGGECPGPADVYWYTYNSFYLLDGAGNFHSVPLNVTISNGFNGNSGCNATTASAYATDGSGYNLEIVGSTGTAIITDVDGNSQSSIVAYDGYISPVATINYSYWSNMPGLTVAERVLFPRKLLLSPTQTAIALSSTITNVDNFEYQQVFKDSLGRTPFTATGYPIKGGPDGNSSTALTWDKVPAKAVAAPRHRRQ